jgi:type IV secretory pathway VirD2 relaxase
MSKVKSSSNGRSSAKSRAKQENRQQAQVLTNFAKALGGKALSAFAIKVKAVQRSARPKSFNQRVTIKSSYIIESNPVKALRLLRAHVDYISRKSAGESVPFSSDNINLSKEDLKTFSIGTPAENEKTYRFIISPENAKNFESDEQFKKYIQECMIQLSRDIEGNPDLVYTARIHYDTDNPHCHVFLKGLSKDGEDVYIPKEYMKNTFREKAGNLATSYLGARSVQDLEDVKLSEVTAKRFTSLDMDIHRISSENGNVFNTKIFDKAVKSQSDKLTNYLIPRLEYLCKIGLATKSKTKYTLDPDYKKTLQEMPLNNDIIKKLAVLKKSHFIESISKFDTSSDKKPVTGIVVEKGYYDEVNELSYAIILDANKKSHYVKLVKNSETEGNEASIGCTVELATKAFIGKNGQEYKYPTLRTISRLSIQKQINHPGITELDKLITSDPVPNDNPNVYQKQTQDAIQARIEKLMAEKRLFLIDGKYCFAKTFWLEAERHEHSALERNFTKLTYYRLSEKETFNGRVVATKQFGNETHAIVSNGKDFIVIPVRGRINKYNDGITNIEVTMNFERKGYSSPIYAVKSITGLTAEPAIKI